jgi:glutaryl-CoA dehydrogenase
VLDGAKRWIGNGSIADVIVVWARSADDGQVKGFLVEKDTPGFEAATMVGKGRLARDLAGRRCAASRSSRTGS